MGNKGNFEPRKPDRTGEQLEKMNAKLERMLKLLEALGQKREPAKEFVKKEAVKEVAKKAPAEKVPKAPKAAKASKSKGKAKK